MFLLSIHFVWLAWSFNVDGVSPVVYCSEDYLKITEEQLKASAAEQQNASSSQSENQIEIESQPQGL